MKGITSRSAKHYTRDKSYYPVPQSTMPLSFHPNFTFTSSETISKENNQQTIREWVENLCPVRQRTVRGKTTKRKKRSPASPQPYCALKGNFSEDVSVQGPKRSKKSWEICLASYSKGCWWGKCYYTAVARSALSDGACNWWSSR